MDAPLVPYRFPATLFLGAGLALAAAGGILLAFGSATAGIACLVVGATPLWVGGLLLRMAGNHERAARALLSDPRSLRWDYDREEWLRYLRAERARPHPLPWILAALFAGAGLLLAALFVAEGDAIGGSPARTWLLLGGGGLGLGALLAVGGAWTRRRAFAGREESEGIFCLGETGAYLTGTYWPWRGLGIRLGECDLDPGPPPLLRLRFSLPRSGVSELRVPVPAGRVEEARALLARLSQA